MGHIHISYDNHNPEMSMKIVKALDLYLSIPLVLMEPDNKRKTMYGKAGAYRLTKYGLEYRSPSNFIFSSPELMKWAFERVIQAIQRINDSNGQFSPSSGIIDTINTNNKKSAQYYVENYGIPLLKLNDNKLKEKLCAAS
jgi:hypothetical protein